MKKNRFGKILLFAGLVAIGSLGIWGCVSQIGRNAAASLMEITLTPDDGLILIVHQVDGKVSLVSGENRETFSISSDAIHYPDPVLSPDGTRIAFRDLDGYLNIYDIQKQKATAYTAVLMGERYPFGWSPDSAKIAYSCVELPAGICIFTLNTGDFKTISSKQDGLLDPYAGYTFAGWSSDGKKIGILDSVDSTTHKKGAENYSVGTIKMLDLETETVTDVFSEYEQPGVTRLQDAVLSPDGSSFLFSAMSGDYYAIYQVQADGSGLTRITGEEYEFHIIHPVWKADGQAFISIAPRQEEGVDGVMLIPTVFDLSGNIVTQIDVDLGGIPTSWIGSAAHPTAE